MKRSIDLTEHEDFRLPAERKNKNFFVHKKVPWKIVGEHDNAERGYYHDSSYSVSYDLDKWFTISYNDRSNYYIDASNKYYAFSKAKKSISEYVNDTFPTGYKKDIVLDLHAMMQLKNIVKKESKYASKIKYCNKCGSRLHVNFNEKLIVYKGCPVCDTDTTKDDHMLIKNDKDPVDLWRTIKISTNRFFTQRCYYDEIFEDVPCLSSNIQKMTKYRVYPKRYIEWRDKMCCTDKKNIQNVYSKNQRIGRRQEPWQPNGRVRQSYDLLFDNTDWRDLLKYRIGELNRDSLLNPRSHTIIDLIDEPIEPFDDANQIRTNRWLRVDTLNEFVLSWSDINDDF